MTISAVSGSKRPHLAVIVAISTLQPFALNVLAPATPGMARSLQTDYATVQLTLTLYLVAVAVTQLVVGPVSDRVGRRPCVIAGCVLFVLGSLLGAVASDIGTLLLSRVIQAVGGGTCFALARAIIRDTASKDEAASLIGYVTMAMVVSPMVAPLVGGFLDARFGWRSIFVATLVLALGVTIAGVLLLRETAPKTGDSTLSGILRTVPALAADRAFIGYTLALSFIISAFFSFVAGAPYVVVEFMGRNPDVYGFYFAINAGGYMVGNFLSGRYGQRIGSERLARSGVMISLFSVTLELIWVALLPWNPASLFLPLTLNAIGNGIMIPGGTASALSVRPDLAGTASGLLGAAQLGFAALSSTIVGFLVPIWPPFLIVAMMICVLLSWLALSLTRPARF